MQNPAIRIKKIMVIILCICMLLPAVSVKAESIGLNVNYRSQKEIQQFFNDTSFNLYDPLSFSTLPSYEEPLSAGEMSEDSLTSALNTVNVMRYIAGLDGDVELDNDLCDTTSAAAYIMALGGGAISHNPERPDAMADSRYDNLYDSGYDGASSSNISAGYKNKVQSILYGYMDDSDSSNIARVGHRRWILNPTMGKTGFGAAVNSDSYYKRYYAMYVFDRSGKGGQSRVAWPAQNTPVQYFNKDTAWSVSIGSRVTAANVTVTLTDNLSGEEWIFSSDSADGDFYVDNTYRGQIGCIIFRPSSLDTIEAGDSFNVKISGALSSDIEYDVNFFNLDTHASENNWSFDSESGELSLNSGSFMPEYGSEYNIPWSNIKSNITSVVINDDITDICDYAFSGCAALTSVMFSNNIKNIGTNAFYGCTSLTDIYYSGSEDRWEQTDIESGNSPLDTANKHWHYGCEGEFGEYTVITPPECEKEGTKAHTCPDCLMTEYLSVEPLGHTFGDWVTLTAPTCQSKGEKAHTCTACLKSFSEETEFLEHCFDGKYCTSCSCSFETFESAHPYGNNADISKTVFFEKAKSLKLEFSDNTLTESGWDHIYIYDSNGELIGKYSGSSLSGETMIIEGDTVTVALKSDGSVSDFYGFFVTVTPLYPDFENGDLNGDGEINVIDMIRIKRRLAGLSATLCSHSDLNQNGSFEIGDITYLRKLILFNL